MTGAFFCCCWCTSVDISDVQPIDRQLINQDKQTHTYAYTNKESIKKNTERSSSHRLRPEGVEHYHTKYINKKWRTNIHITMRLGELNECEAVVVKLLLYPHVQVV